MLLFLPADSVTKTSTPSVRNNKATAQQGSPWETLVVFAINLKQLIVQMNMSNVMGNNTYEPNLKPHTTSFIYTLIHT